MIDPLLSESEFNDIIKICARERKLNSAKLYKDFLKEISDEDVTFPVKIYSLNETWKHKKSVIFV